jgi:hypothetical protein
MSFPLVLNDAEHILRPGCEVRYDQIYFSGYERGGAGRAARGGRSRVLLGI